MFRLLYKDCAREVVDCGGVVVVVDVVKVFGNHFYPVGITYYDDVVGQLFRKEVEVINSSAVINNQLRFSNTAHMFFVKKITAKKLIFGRLQVQV